MQTEPKQLPFIDYHPVISQDSNEAIRVVVRFRTNENKDIDSISIKEDGKSVTIKRVESVRKSLTLTHRGSIRGALLDPNVQQKTKVFHYDAVTDKDDQKVFYESYAKDNVLAFIKGFNSSILAYGSTGSGKTFTIIGDESAEHQILKSNCKDYFPQNEKQGILPRSIQTIYEEMEEGRQKGIKYSLKCSYLEVYNEELTDLLCKGGQHSKHKPLECPKRGIVIQHMIEEPVNSYQDIFKCLQKGVNNRRVCITNDNNRSSRSHTIFMLNLEQLNIDQTQILSRLCIVDLAGSEKLQSNQKNRQLETKNINTSLLTLAKCITHLSKATDKNDKKHVPFRESKLTRILKESLGGNSKTTLICAARFSEKFQEETIQTLRFAREAKKIQNQLEVKIVYTQEQLLEQIEKLKQENALLHKELLILKKQLTVEQLSSAESTTGCSSNEGPQPLPLTKKSNYHPKTVETHTYQKSKSGIAKLSKQSSQIIDDNTLIKQHQELIDYKIRFETLKKSSEEQIMNLHQEIKKLNEQVSKSSDNKIEEIELAIQKLSSKYYQQEQEIQEEKKIIRDVQKVLADTQTSPNNSKKESKLLNDFQMSTEDEENRNSEDRTSCHLMECVFNRMKVQKFENLFVEFEKQYTKLYQENQISRNILSELSHKLKGTSLHDLNLLNDSQHQIFGDNDSFYGSYHKDEEEDQQSIQSFDEIKEEQYMTQLTKEIEEFSKQNKTIQAQMQYFCAKVNKYNVLNQSHINPPDDSLINKKQAMSETFIPLKLIDDLESGDKHEGEIRSPQSTIIPQENRGSSRRDAKMKFNKNFLNSSFFRYTSGGEKTPQSSLRPFNSGFNQQDTTPQNRLNPNQSYISNSSKFSDLLESNLADLDLSRIENSMYDDYEDESISENLYGNQRILIEQKENKGGDSYSHKKQLFSDVEIPDVLNMSDSRMPTKRLQHRKSLNLSQNNLSFNNDSNDNQQALKPSQSDIFGYKSGRLSKSFNKQLNKSQKFPVQAVNQ